MSFVADKVGTGLGHKIIASAKGSTASNFKLYHQRSRANYLFQSSCPMASIAAFISNNVCIFFFCSSIRVSPRENNVTKILYEVHCNTKITGW